MADHDNINAENTKQDERSENADANRERSGVSASDLFRDAEKQQLATMPKAQETGENSLFVGVEKIPGRQYEAFDGRVFTKVDNSDSWKVTHSRMPLPEQALVTNFTVNPDRSISYKTGNASVTERTNGCKEIQVEGKTYLFDKTGAPLGQVPGNSESIDPLFKKMELIATTAGVPLAGERTDTGEKQDRAVKFEDTVASLPVNLQGAANQAIQDINQKLHITEDLEKALRTAAAMGKLDEFCRVVTSELAARGCKATMTLTAPPQAMNGVKLVQIALDGKVTDAKPLRLPLQVGLPRQQFEAVPSQPTEQDLEAKQERQSKLEAIKKDLGNVDSARTRIKSLTDEAKAGGPDGEFARKVLTQLLVPSEARDSWNRLDCNKFDMDLKDFEGLDFSGLDARQRTAMRIHVAESFVALNEKSLLNSSEFAALGTLLMSVAGEPVAKSAVDTVMFKIRNPLINASTKETKQQNEKGVEEALSGLFDVMRSSERCTAGSRAVAEEYCKLLRSQNNQSKSTMDSNAQWNQQFSEIVKSAKTGNADAIFVLGSIAGGKDNWSSEASEILLALATGDSTARHADDPMMLPVDNPMATRELNAEIVKQLCESPKDLNDQGRRLETLGKIVAQNGGEMPAEVEAALVQGLQSADSHQSALRGLLALGDKLSHADIAAMARTFTAGDEAIYKEYIAKLPPAQARDLCKLLSDLTSLTSGPVEALSKEQYIGIVRTLGTLADAGAGVDAVGALARFGERGSNDGLATQLQRTIKGDEAAVKKAVQEIQAEAGSSLLGVSENTSNEQLKTTAFVAFESSSWGDRFQAAVAGNSPEGTSLHYRLLALAANNPENISIQRGVPKMVTYSKEEFENRDKLGPKAEGGASFEPARLAAAFRNQGLEIDDDPALRLSEAAIRRFGKEAGPISDNLALFNSLPADVRNRLTAFDTTLTEGKPLNLSGRQISKETFDKLSSEVQLQLRPDGSPLPPGVVLSGKDLEGKTITAESFNRLPVDVRFELSGSREPLPESQSLSLASRTVDAGVFNRLPESVRIELTGSAARMKETPAYTFAPGRAISAEFFSGLPSEVQQSLVGPDAGPSKPGTMIPLDGKQVDNALLNLLSDAQRLVLTGSAESLPEGEKVPDLSRVRLTGEQLKTLTDEQLQQLGFKRELLANDAVLSLGGRTIDAKTFNAYPADVRKAILGSDELLASDRVLRDLSHISIDASTFNSLSPMWRKALSGIDDRLTPEQVLAQMADGRINNVDSEANVLLNGKPPFISKIEKLRVEAEYLADFERKKARKFESEKDATLNALEKQSVTGVGVFNKFGAELPKEFKLQLDRDFGEAQRDFISEQKRGLRTVRVLQQESAEARTSAQLADMRAQSLQMSIKNWDFVRLNREGRVREADLTAVQLFGQYGRSVFLSAPQIAQSLASNGEGSNSSCLARLAARKEVQYSSLQIVTETNPEKMFFAALDMLSKINPERPKTLTAEATMYSDAAAVRKEAFDNLDADPTLQRLNKMVADLSEDLEPLQRLVGIMKQDGDKFEDFVAECQRRKAGIMRILQEFNNDQAFKDRLYLLRDKMEESLKSITDPTAKESLQRRIDALDRALQMIDIAYPEAKYHPDQVKKLNELRSKTDPDSRLEANRLDAEMHPMRGIIKAFNFMNDTKNLKSTDFKAWMEKEGVELAISITVAAIACAAVAAALPSGGTSLLVGLAVITAVAATGALSGMLAREITREVQVEMGIRNDGSKVGDYLRNTKKQDKWGFDRDPELFKDVIVPYTVEFTVETALGVATGGLSKFGGSVLSKATAPLKSLLMRQSSLACKVLTNAARVEAAMATGSYAKRASWEALKDLASKPVDQAGDELASNAIQYGSAQCGLKLEQNNKLLGFVAGVVSSSCFSAMNPKVRHGRTAGVRYSSEPNVASGNRKRASDPEVTFEFNASQSQVDAYIKDAQRRNSTVRVTRDGFEETTVDGLRVRWENQAAARGAGRPKAEMNPEGVAPGKQQRTPLEEKIPLKEGEWKQTAEGKKILQEIDDFTDHVMKPNGAGLESALKVATTADGLPPGTKLVGADSGDRFDVKAFNAASPAEQKTMLQNYMEKMSVVSKMSEDGKVAQYAEVMVSFEGHTFNLATGKPVGTNKPTGEAVKAMELFKNSPGGKRLLQEQAIHAMEERIHLQHQAIGNAAFSPSYVKYMNESGLASHDHLAGKGRTDRSQSSRDSLEEELIFALYDKGWSVEHLRHHFEGHHTKARAEAFNWLETEAAKNQLKKLPIHEEARAELLDYLSGDSWREDSGIRWRREQLKDLLQRLETMPADAFKLGGAFRSAPLRYAAYMNNPELINKPLDEIVVIARGETKDSWNETDWTTQDSTAIRYYFDKPKGDRQLHVVVIVKGQASLPLWRWAKENSTGMDNNKENNHWVDRRAYEDASGETEKTCPDRLIPKLNKEAKHYKFVLD